MQSSEETPTQSLGALAAVLEEARLALDAPAALLAVARQEGEALLLADGIADQRSGREASPVDTFSVGSVTKPLIAIVLLQLCSEGLLSLDSTPDAYGIAIPHGAEITLRQLLQHSSGVFNFGNDLYGKPLPLLRAFSLYDWSFEDVRQIIASHAPDFAPGASLRYSNSNYILAGQMAERATGTKLGALLRSRIFEPLGLKRMRYAADEEGERPTLRGYAQSAWGGDDVTELETYRLFGPGGGIVAAAAEIIRLSQAIESGELLDPPWQALLRDQVMWDEAQSSGMSCGLQHFRREWASFRGHGGNTHGYTSGMWYFPDDRLHLVFGLNRAYTRERPLLERCLEYVRRNGL